MPQFRFGSGLLYVQSNTGPSFQFGTLQDASVDIESETKMLYGSNDFPDIIANGKSKCSIKAKFGQISGALFNSIFFGGTSSAGMTMLALAELQAIGSTTPNTVVASNASGSNIVANSAADLGVRYNSTGAALTLITTGSPTQGQYMFAAGTYTFSAADAGAQVLISYTYKTNTVLTGTTFVRNQQLMGTSLFFSLFLANSFNGLQSNMKFFRVKCSKLSLQSKNDDFTVPEMDFTAFADPAGRVFETYEASS